MWRDLSAGENACFRFTGGGLNIEAEVSRAQFESWIAPDIAEIEKAVDRALVRPGDAALVVGTVLMAYCIVFRTEDWRKINHDANDA